MTFKSSLILSLCLAAALPALAVDAPTVASVQWTNTCATGTKTSSAVTLDASSYDTAGDISVSFAGPSGSVGKPQLVSKLPNFTWKQGTNITFTASKPGKVDVTIMVDQDRTKNYKIQLAYDATAGFSAMPRGTANPASISTVLSIPVPSDGTVTIN